MKQFALKAVRTSVAAAMLLAAPALIGGMGIAPLTDGVAIAQQKNKTVKVKAISAKVYKQMEPIQLLMEENKNGEALAKARSLESAAAKWQDHEKARLYQVIGSLYQDKEDYKTAISYYGRVLKLEIDPGTYNQTLLAYGFMQYGVEDYRGAIKSLSEYSKNVEIPNLMVYEVTGSAYYNLKDYGNTLKWINKAIDYNKTQGKIGKETWYQMRVAVYTERNDIKNIVANYEILAKNFTKKRYLTPLASYYGELGQEKKRLALYDAVYQSKMFTKENEIMNIAYMWSGDQVPYKAASIVDKGMKDGVVSKKKSKNVEYLANMWRMSREDVKAIPVMESAARLSADGENYSNLALVYFNVGQFEKAVKAAEQAERKGKMKRPDYNYLTWGQALVELKRWDEATKVFNKALKDKRSKKYAESYLRFVANEKARYAAFKAHMES